MKAYSKFLVFILIICAFSAAIFCFHNTQHLSSQLYSKTKQLEKAEQINKYEKKINANNSEIIALHKSIVSRKDRQIQELTSNNQKQASSTGFTYGNKSISTEELLTIFNNTYKENEHNKAVIAAFKKHFGISSTQPAGNSFGISVDSNSVFKATELSHLNKIIKLTKQIDSLEDKAFILSFIQKRYQIPYKFDGKTISISYNKLDSLLDIYPLIKDKIRIDDKRGKIWIKGL
jgi:hypothetical protein